MLKLKKWHLGELETLKNSEIKPKTFSRLLAVVVMVLSFFYFLR